MLFERVCLPWEGIPLVLTVIKHEQIFKNPTTLPLFNLGSFLNVLFIPKSLFSLLPLTWEDWLVHTGVSQQYQEEWLSELWYCFPIRCQTDCHYNVVSTCKLMKSNIMCQKSHLHYRKGKFVSEGVYICELPRCRIESYFVFTVR